MNNLNVSQVFWGLMSAALASAAAAQTAKAPTQVVKPPVSQAWIDVSTFTGMGLPAVGGAGASPMAMMGRLFGGGQRGKNVFGMTQTGSAGRWIDVTLSTSRNPALSEALQAVRASMSLAPTLKLVTPKAAKGTLPTPGDDSVMEPEFERPKAKMLLCRGCGDTCAPTSHLA